MATMLFSPYSRNYCSQWRVSRKSVSTMLPPNSRRVRGGAVPGGARSSDAGSSAGSSSATEGRGA
eukprot:2412630-Pyramimonas_sp.AAC.1